MILPTWAIVLLSVIGAGVVVTFAILASKIAEEDWGMLKFVIPPILYLAAFTLSLCWWIWVWFWLYARFND